MIIVLTFVIGLSIGSFISASVWRLHEQEELRRTNKKPKKELSITKGRSMCEHCGHQLSALDLIPLISWFSLRGRCRYCKTKLSWEYPIVELVTGLLFAMSYTAWEFAEVFDYISFGFWILILSGLIFLALYDIKWLILPNKVVYPLITAAIFLVVLEATVFDGGAALVRDRVLGLAFIGGIFYLLFLVSSGKWIGGGDVKLGILIGILLGLPRSILTFVLAFNTAAVVILPLLVFGIVKRKTPVPFGPFLIVATIIGSLYGYELIQWYSDAFLYGLI